MSGRGLFIVATIDTDPIIRRGLVGPLYFSASADGRFDGLEYSDTVLTDVALVSKSATVGKSPVEFIDTTLAEGHWPSRHEYAGLLRRSRSDWRERRSNPFAPLVIADYRIVPRGQQDDAIAGR